MAEYTSRADALTEHEMHAEYDAYLTTHINNLRRGYEWLRRWWPELLADCGPELEMNLKSHDASKRTDEEYHPYAVYFFSGTTRTDEIKENFQKAWLHHIHNNPHHWNHWVVINENRTSCVEMPDVYVIEMILDWWTFSWKSQNLRELGRWYREHKSGIQLHPKTRARVEEIVEGIMTRLSDRIASYVEP